jgi:hypothetical protein
MPPLGIEYVRPLSGTEIALFQEVKSRIWQLNSDKIAALSAKKQTYWLNLVMRSRAGQERLNCFGLAPELIAQFRQTIAALRDEIFVGHTLLSAGFSINPAGSKPQKLHIEYYKDIGVIFVTLNPLKFTNSVVFYEPAMTEPEISRYSDGLGYINNPSEDLIGPVRYKSYIECDPYHIIKLSPNIVHAAAGNTEDYDRIMVNAVVAKDAAMALNEDEYLTDPL